MKLLEKHQCKKCEKCPFYWHDGYYSESGCYIAECRYGNSLAKWQELLSIDYYSGCFIPTLSLKLLWVIKSCKDYLRYKINRHNDKIWEEAEQFISGVEVEK